MTRSTRRLRCENRFSYPQRRVGLEIPRTLISNNAETIRDFWRSLDGKCIYKPLTSPSWTFAETRVLTDEDLCHLDRLRHAPMIVQEKVDKGVDVRVNIFGNTVYACEVKTSIPEAELDWRIDVSARWYEHQLPQDVASKLIDLPHALKLHYGCIDLRRQSEGVYRFFEVNPSGQFLFAEIDTGQPLLRFLAELLIDAGTTLESTDSPARPEPANRQSVRMKKKAIRTQRVVVGQEGSI